MLYLIAGSKWRAFWNHNTWVELPIIVCSVQVQDYPDVIDQDDIDVQSACDESCGLEKIVVTLVETSRTISIYRDLARILCEPSIFVDKRELLNNIVVVTIEHDEKRANAGRKA